MIISRQLRMVLAVSAIGLLPAKALAASALAVGVTGNPRDGIAYGFSYNYSSVEDAERAAMNKCRDYKAAPKAARRCKLVGGLKKGCIAVAFDPKSDSPGMGWAVAARRADVELRALNACKNAAPAGRQIYCKIDVLRCDGDEPPASERH